MPKFYKERLNFGFTVVLPNITDFRINPVQNSKLPDTVIISDNVSTRYRINTVFSQPAPGFAVGFISDFRIQEYVRLRFTPTISFASRKIEYGLSNAARDSFKIFQKEVASTFLIFPIETKIQSKRLENFSAYIIGGGGYMLDLNSRKSAGGAPNQLDDNIKLKRDDFFYSAGAGVDFYLKYCKLGFDIKLLIGTKNLLKPGSSIFTNSIEKIRSRMVTFTFTIEG